MYLFHRPDSTKEMYVQCAEVEGMVSSLDKKIDTLQQVKSGNVPPPPTVAPTPLAVSDPQVNIVEVSLKLSFVMSYLCIKMYFSFIFYLNIKMKLILSDLCAFLPV